MGCWVDSRPTSPQQTILHSIILLYNKNIPFYCFLLCNYYYYIIYTYTVYTVYTVHDTCARGANYASDLGKYCLLCRGDINACKQRLKLYTVRSRFTVYFLKNRQKYPSDGSIMF